MIQAGQYITDGTCVWIVDDIRDGDRVGDVVFHSVLLPGHILADGAAAADVSTDYPRLLSWARANNMTTLDSTDMGKYYYDSEADTLRVPKADDGRFVEGSTTAGTVHAAGLPNITGEIVHFQGDTVPLVTSAWGSGTGAIHSDSMPYSLTAAPSSGSFTLPKNLQINASLSNSIYGNSNTVQPKSLTSIAQIKY